MFGSVYQYICAIFIVYIVTISVKIFAEQGSQGINLLYNTVSEKL